MAGLLYWIVSDCIGHHLGGNTIKVKVDDYFSKIAICNFVLKILVSLPTCKNHLPRSL